MQAQNGSALNISSLAQTTNTPVLLPVDELKITVQINKTLQTLSKPSAEFIELNNSPRKWTTTEFTLSQFSSFIAAGGTWRPSIKTGGNKKKDISFIGTVALDFDTQDSLPAYHELNEYSCIQHTTLSHSAAEPWKQRLIFVFDRPVDVETYEKISKILLAQYPKADQSCWDAGRFFFGSNQPCLAVRNVTLPVDFLLSTFALPESPKRPVGRPKKDASESETTTKKSSKKAATNTDKTPCELIYDLIYTRLLDADAEQLYCLYPHQFKERDDVQDGYIKKLVGSNPFSTTNSSGTSFAVSEKEGQLPIWYDKSGNAEANKYSGTEGGSFLHYWFQLHHDFVGTGQKFSPFPVLVSIFTHFGVRIPAQFKYEHLKQQLRNDLRYKLRFNRMGNRIEYNGEELSEGILSWASKELGISHIAAEPLYQCVEAVARENTYHPFLEAVEKLAETISPDLDLWENLPLYLLNIPKSDPLYNLYTVFLQKFFCAIYSRVKFPGIKYDVVLIFQGQQGTGKSTWFRNAVLGRQFFTDSANLNNDKDSVMIEQRAVLHELPEVKAHFVRDIGHIRHAISQSETQVRMPYARSAVTIKRHSLFCATANEQEILQDSFGNRRFQVVRIGSTKLRPDKSLFKVVWATVHSLLAGYSKENVEDLEEYLELPEEYRDLSHQNNKDFETTDVLEETISATLHRQFLGRDFQFSELLAIIYPGNAAVNKGEQARVSTVLRKLGYDKKQKRVDSGRIYVWYKVATLAAPQEVAQEVTVPRNEELPQQPTQNIAEPQTEPANEVLALPPSTTEVVIIPELDEPDTLVLSTKEVSEVPEQPKQAELTPLDPDADVYVDDNGRELLLVSTDFVPRKPGQKRNVTLQNQDDNEVKS